MRTLVVCSLLIAAGITSGCMAVTLQPLYTADTLVSEPSLVGTWHFDGDAAGFPFGGGADSSSAYTISESGSCCPSSGPASDSSTGCYSMLVTRQDGTVTLFSLHLLKLGGYLFADVCPDVDLGGPVVSQANPNYQQDYRQGGIPQGSDSDPGTSDSQRGFQPGGYQPWNLAVLHNVYLIERVEPTLRFKRLNPKWLEAYLAANPEAIAHSRIDDQHGGSLPVLTGSPAELQAFFLRHVDTPEAYFGLREMLPGKPLY